MFPARRLALCALVLAVLAGRATAQALVEVPTPSVAMNTIDMDQVGPSGAVDLAMLNAAAQPRSAGLLGFHFTPTLTSASRYDSGLTNGRGLALDPSGAAPALVDPPRGSYRAGDLSIDLGGPSTEFGIGIGDYGGSLQLELYAGAQLFASATSTAFGAGGAKFFRAMGGRFDRVVVRAPLGSNWVLTELHVPELEGLFPRFQAAPPRGAAPLSVAFSDASTTSDPAGIATWAWDFEDDGIVDDQTPSPSFSYAACGDYDVRLTVSDALHGSATLVRRGLIAVDPLDADFEAEPRSGCAPLVVQLFDRSRGGATAWEWDFDDDGVVDSVLQHPLHVFTGADRLYDVRLRVTSACRPQGTSAVKRGYVRTIGELPTLFAANSGGAVGGAVYFDLELRAPIALYGLETSFDAPVGTSVGLSLYLTSPGLSGLGVETQPSAWSLAAQDDGAASSAGLDAPTRLRFAQPLSLAPGRIGVALVARGDGHRYTAFANPGPRRYEDAFLSIEAGSATNAPFSGALFAPRAWNGALLYCLECVGAASPFGTGCADAGGQTLAFYAHGCPDLGAPIGLGLSSPGASPGAAAFFAMGLSDVDWLGLMLPIALDPLGAPGCSVFSSHDLVLGPYGFVRGSLSLPVVVPLDGLLTAAPSFWQAYSFDPAQNALGVATSNALRVDLR
ncbi:MAG: PKD domain-containing protein [Planctomycetes bacterium]|nr:PKD domain-containing protein [Planctomycetota bacterium]